MATETITVTVTDDNVEIASPYNPDVIATLKDLGGKWSPRGRTWNVPLRAEQEARQALLAAFGTDGSAETAADVVMIELTACELVIADKGPVTFCGVTIAKAFGRDSGAKPGPSTSLISGKIDSCGSRANWGTEVREGATFRVELPRAALDLADGDEWSYKIVTPTDDQREALTARREALLAELAKVETELADLDYA